MAAPLVKENRPEAHALPWRWAGAALAASACALLAVARLDAALPEPRARAAARPDQFVAQNAHDHLVNLTALGPRVAGSYENEVAAVALLAAAVRGAAAQAGAHNRVQLDVQRASGAFALGFMDGMSNVYRDVQSVVARVAAAGDAPRARPRPALLLNCHYDTVPDSPGASDDGAGCAVLLETLRALAASPRPLRHDAVFLFNGAEENILQASHAFVTQHKWARSVRAFVNLEACGAGGREILFQAGPHDPWIVEVYAGTVPHPFASSLAQELFESGLIPADTDFRIFRDFGKLSGVDLAWSANGYVYHTRLDTPERVPLGALQRTGDNVLALAHGLLSSESMESAVEESSRQPVFFDVLGALVVAVRAPAALAAALATLALVLAKVHLSARDAAAQLYVGRAAWWRAVGVAAAVTLAAAAAGVLAATGVAAALHALGARLTFYSRPALLAPLYAAPALAACWAAAARAARGGRAVLLRGWWLARAYHDAHAALAGAALAACALCGLRSGFLPLLWAALPPAADALASLTRAPRAAAWALGAALPLLQTCYLLLSSLQMFVPIMGRAGSRALPPDVAMAALTAALALTALSWMLPLVVATRSVHKLAWALAGVCAAAAALVLTTPLGAAYSELAPQRLMVFHTRRTVHAPGTGAPAVDLFYWVPELDANTRRTVDRHLAGAGAARALGAAECAARLFCGAPYPLPVRSLVTRSLAVPLTHAPLARLEAAVSGVALAGGGRALLVNVTRAPRHVVLIVAPPPGAKLAWSSALAAPLAGAPWGARRTYFITLHAARARPSWLVELHVRGARGRTHVSLAGHAMAGARRRSAEHERALAALPPTVAATGWGVDLHLYEL